MKNFKAMGAVKHAAQKGFTIIELVVVILLLGILTATALPRFLDISEEAHDAVVDGLQGGLRTGLALYKANWFALSQPTTAIADWGNLIPNSLGFPVGIAGGTSDSVLDRNAECKSIYDQIIDINAGAPNSIDASTLTTTYADTTDIDTTALTDAQLGQAGALTTGEILPVMKTKGTSSITGVCRFYYVGDAQRLSTTTTPYLDYALATGILTKGP